MVIATWIFLGKSERPSKLVSAAWALLRRSSDENLFSDRQTDSLIAVSNEIMKKVKRTPIQVEPAKAEPVKIIAAKPVTASEPLTPAPMPGRISFEFVKVDAKSVCVAGTFNNWKPEMAPLAPVGNGRWSGDLSIKPGRYEYLFVVDGQWMPDPNAKESVQNPFGGRNSIFGVSE